MTMPLRWIRETELKAPARATSTQPYGLLLLPMRPSIGLHFVSFASEPMNAVVSIEGDEADVWTGIQFPFSSAGLVSRIADIPAKNVRFHQTYLGGGFGRRGTPSHLVEAAEIAKTTGKPIQLVWTREMMFDMAHFDLRPSCASEPVSMMQAT